MKFSNDNIIIIVLIICCCVISKNSSKTASFPDRCDSPSMRVVARPLLPVDVRRNPQRPRGQSPSCPVDTHVHTLAGWNGLCLLLRVVYIATEGGAEARSAVVLEKLE